MAGDAHSNWDYFRSLMEVTRKWAYYDHAAVAPLPVSTGEAVSRLLREAVAEGDTVWPSWFQRQQQIRKVAAAMINASEAEVAFVPSTTHGIGLVAEGIDWRPGDNVVTLENEFPSNLYPWQNLLDRGVQVRLVPVENGHVDLGRIADHCDPRTRVVSVSWIGYASGWRIDVDACAQLAHDKGAYFFLDAIQGLGVFPLDVKQSQVDFLSADGHKWMMGPEGAGLMYIRQELLPELRPLGVGWNSVVNRGDYANHRFELRNEASRYEGGSPNMIGTHGLGASLDLLTELGLSPHSTVIADRVVQLADEAAARLESFGATIVSPREPGHLSGILVFAIEGVEPSRIRDACQAQGVAVSCRGGGVRLSPHAYNNAEDLDKLMQVLESVRVHT